MKVLIMPGGISGKVSAIPSKSHLHRILIYAALSDGETNIFCRETNAEDIRATIDCLMALGAVISKNENGFSVSPIDGEKLPVNSEKPLILPCCESGSTLRFMLPVINALGVHGAFHMEGRLSQRPLVPLDEQLKKHGIEIWNESENVLCCKGQLIPADDYILPGNISSQYISGLLMALPLLNKPSRLSVTAPIESADYIELTLNTAEKFDCEIKMKGTEYEITPTAFKSPKTIEAEGDWSNSAFWLCAGAMQGGDIKMTGLNRSSTQGDREIYEILEKMGAKISCEGGEIHVQEDRRRIIEINGSAIPDLIPVLAAVASVGEGETVFKNAERLRIKESDRLMSTTKTLSALGADICETQDGLLVRGKKSLRGGIIDAHGDHRIAMTAAIASAACTENVVITGAQAVNKSYPAFWSDLRSLGKTIIEE